MPAKAQQPKEKDDRPQYQRFVEKAKELGADETGAEFERLFRKVVPAKGGEPST